MSQDSGLVIEPMRAEALHWRCLHDGSPVVDRIFEPPANARLPWDRYRRRNVLLLAKLTAAYGSCAMLARDGERIVGHLRFYPKTVSAMMGAEGLCLQQDAPAGPADDFVAQDFPPEADLPERTLVVHCLMTGAPMRAENPYQRKGLGSRLVRGLVEWARPRGWRRIDADAFEDLPIIYETTGSAGRTFWEKLGFAEVDRSLHPDLKGRDPFILELERQAAAAGIPVERAKERILMRLELADPD